MLTAGFAMAVSSLSAVPSSATGTAAPQTSTVDEQTIVMVPNRYIVTLNGHPTRDGSLAADASAAAVRWRDHDSVHAAGQPHGCIQGTSIASPHAAGAAALIVSQFGRLGADGDMKMSPVRVERILETTAVDIGKRGYDECFGHGRIDAKRAVSNLTTGSTTPRPRSAPRTTSKAPGAGPGAEPFPGLVRPARVPRFGDRYATGSQ